MGHKCERWAGTVAQAFGERSRCYGNMGWEAAGQHAEVDLAFELAGQRWRGEQSLQSRLKDRVCDGLCGNMAGDGRDRGLQGTSCPRAHLGPKEAHLGRRGSDKRLKIPGEVLFMRLE